MAAGTIADIVGIEVDNAGPGCSSMERSFEEETEDRVESGKPVTVAVVAVAVADVFAVDVGGDIADGLEGEAGLEQQQEGEAAEPVPEPEGNCDRKN